MNYRQAEHLLAVYEEGSVSRAASRLGVSQPAISQTIQTAEREIGMRIFQRGPDGRSLTYAGEKYLSAARRLMALEGNLGRELQELRGEHSGKLRIGISSLRGMVLLPQILPGFLEQHSAVNPVLVEAAELDGASKWHVFWHVTLPQLRPTTFFVTITLTIASFKVYDQMYMITQGGPGDATITLVYDIYNIAFVNTPKYGYASAVAMVLFALVLAITLFQFRNSSNND